MNVLILRMPLKFPHKQLDGVLKYFYTNFQDNYWNLFNYTANHFSTHYVEYAFDWIHGNFWKSNDREIEICFTNHKLWLTGYEIKSNSGGKC